MVRVKESDFSNFMKSGSSGGAGKLKFAIGRYEVTNEEYADFLNDLLKGRKEIKDAWFDGKKNNPKSRLIFKGGRIQVAKGYERHPVSFVSWVGAVAYTNWLSGKSGQTYRLPSVEEWVIANKAGSRHKFFYGDELEDICMYANVVDISYASVKKAAFVKCDDLNVGPARVGSYLPNKYKLFDTTGNVKERTSTCKTINKKEEDCESRMAAGGSFSNLGWDDKGLTRTDEPRTDKSEQIGFRVLLEE
ncbi:SUMF1/EgtB/PvdO family nonheme iron enzyme [uncultured Roseibium sp.]|uniref:formylglycine-generating enzyme family protein n=1 Tax=uncultured Roseibium sp. TaxID=1936171 RepID=UPI0032170A03